MLEQIGTSTGMAVWSTPQCPFVIQYSRRLLTDINLACLSGRCATPRGGMEIGGILLGKFHGDRMIVSDHKALDCEHAFGPLFRLSDNDRLRMAGMLSRSGTDGPVVLGWYRSVSRGSIGLSDADLELYRRYFPEQWSVVLLIKPSLYSASAGFFFREQDGTVRTSSSYREWQLEDEMPGPEIEVRTEPAKPAKAEAAAAVEKQPQTPIDTPVPQPRSVLLTSPPPSPPPPPLRELAPPISSRVSNAPVPPAPRPARFAWSPADFLRKSLPALRNAIPVRKPVMMGAIVGLAVLLFVWWNQRSAKTHVPLSERSAVQHTLRSTTRKGAPEAQRGAPPPLSALPPDKPAVTETVAQTHDAPAADTKPPARRKKSISFDPLIN